MSELDKVVERIAECETVISQMDGSEVWQIVAKDCNKWVEQIDSRWQTVTGDKLEEMRIFKLAYSHILNLKDRYVQDLDSAKKMAATISEQDKSIRKDYDNSGVK